MKTGVSLPWSYQATALAIWQDHERLFLQVDSSGGPSTPNGKLSKESWTTNANGGINRGYKVSFVAYVEAAGYRTEIARGRLVKSQKVAGALCPKRTVGRWSEVLARVSRRDSISDLSAGKDGYLGM